MEKSIKQDLERMKDKLIIYNGKEVSLEELKELNPADLRNGSINVYSTQQSVEKFGEKGKMELSLLMLKQNK
ncbi:hypothetical protein QNH98_10645 [Myroides sp. mNGS23_01]|nr:hypothetical protein [Myroides sp. mNGS23_01]WHT37647.1 hypothetical protein QNH98_10645 [Myroides sp. mNGS23_01]